MALLTDCLPLLVQNVYYTQTQQLYVGLLSPTIDDDDNKCLVDVNSRPRLLECSYAAAKRMKLYWIFTQVSSDWLFAQTSSDWLLLTYW